MEDGYRLHVKLRSDGTFGRGGRLPGRLDTEIEHEAKTGLPFVRGRVLKGLLVEACGTVVQSLRQQPEQPGHRRLREAAARLFGRPGSRAEQAGQLHVGRARLPRALRKAVERDVRAGRYTAETARESLTAVRHQTAIDDETGAPAEGSLRNRRVLLRGTELAAPLSPGGDDAEGVLEDELALLSACARLVRRGGLHRSRGGARLRVRLDDPHQEGEGAHAQHFAALARGTAGA
jgi:hypothetical protein